MHTTLARRALVTPLIGLLLVTAAACGGEAKGAETDRTTDPTEQVVEDARNFLGQHERDLPDDVRIGRRGTEQYALTMDLVPGRVTVELDDLDGSGYRVVTVIVETEDGSESFDLEAS